MAVQFIRSARRGKPATWYVYAYKGGPRIMTHVGPRRPSLDATASRKLSEALAAKEAPPAQSDFMAIIRAWQKSPEWDQLADSTKKVWRTHVDRIEEKWGKFPSAIWNDPRMKAKVIQWRNTRKDTPRTADIGVRVLATLLKWANLCGHDIAINVAADIPQLYRGGNRQEIIWLADDIDRFLETAKSEGKPWIGDGLRLAATTGFRLADLVTLTFDHIGEDAINKVALKKSRGKRRRAIIPITAQLGELLEELSGRHRADGVTNVLVNSFGRAWTESGFGGSFNAIRDLAGIVHIDEDGEEKSKHLHDVRGTFCTMLLTECELTDEQAAEIMAWSPDRVRGIRKVYVDESQARMALARRVSAKQKAKQGAQ
jgi:integrase